MQMILKEQEFRNKIKIDKIRASNNTSIISTERDKNKLNKSSFDDRSSGI